MPGVCERKKGWTTKEESEDKENFADDELGVPKGRLKGLGRSERNGSLKQIRHIAESLRDKEMNESDLEGLDFLGWLRVKGYRV